MLDRGKTSLRLQQFGDRYFPFGEPYQSLPGQPIFPLAVGTRTNLNIEFCPKGDMAQEVG